jgi:hypothetical protein
VAYYNNNNGGGYGRNNNSGGYNRGGYSGGGYNRAPKKKRSGCTRGYAKGDQDKPFVRGWNASRIHGITSIFCSPYRKTEDHESKAGRVWQNWMAKVQVGRGAPYIVGCMYEVATGRVIVKDLGFVLNPNKNYCGGFSRKRN